MARQIPVAARSSFRRIAECRQLGLFFGQQSKQHLPRRFVLFVDKLLAQMRDVGVRNELVHAASVYRPVSMANSERNGRDVQVNIL
jgi:hypothetical protein